MRSYDSPGDVVTIFIREDQREFYPAGDMNVEIGDLRGITQGPVDPETGLLNVCVAGVYNRTVQIDDEYGLVTGSKIWFAGPDALGLPGSPEDPPFGILLDDAPNGTTTVRVRLMG